MSIKYELYPLSVGKDVKECKKRYYPHVASLQTYGIDEIAHLLHHRSTYTEGELKGMMELLSNAVGELMMDGNRVHLKGIGYFSPTLTCSKPIEKMDARNLKIELKDIVFRPDTLLKKQMASAEFESTPGSTRFDIYSDEEWNELLNTAFAEQDYLTSRDLVHRSGASSTAVWRRLRRWTEEGKIRNIGARSHAVYVQVKEKG